MAKKMTENGQAKFKAGDRAYVNWEVSVNDILQWIGVWLYMLAFH